PAPSWAASTMTVRSRNARRTRRSLNTTVRSRRRADGAGWSPRDARSRPRRPTTRSRRSRTRSPAPRFLLDASSADAPRRRSLTGRPRADAARRRCAVLRPALVLAFCILAAPAFAQTDPRTPQGQPPAEVTPHTGGPAQAERILGRVQVGEMAPDF